MRPWQCLALTLALVPTTALAAPSLDQNAGAWSDAFSDSSGLEAGTVNGEAGQSNVTHDPFGRLVTLSTGADAGYFYTAAITPSSFSGWGRVYVDFTSATAAGVTVAVHHGVTGALLGTLDLSGPGSASNDPAYTRMASLATIAAGAPSVRLRVALTRGAQPIAPTVKALKVTWTPRSVLQVALEAPATRQTGDGIVLRVAASVSYVSATGFVAWVPAPSATNNRYGQPADLTFVSATEGGLYHAGPSPLVLGGATIPPRSVYWSRPTLAAGNTFAYYATFRSPNGLVTDISYPFRAHVAATNGDPASTAVHTTRLTSTARGYFHKTSSGTFILGGQAYAHNDALVTMRLTAGDWAFQSIPTGAQDWFEGVVYDSVADLIAKGAIDPPFAGAISSISDGGAFTATAITVNGVAVPANSVYWDLDRVTIGQVRSLSYQVQLNGDIAANQETTLNACTGGAREAWFLSGQQTVTGTNACAPAGSCDPLSFCHPIIIGVDSSPGVAFAKGDQINGSAAIRGNFNDNAGAFVTYGAPITFKLSVGNSGVSSLQDVVLLDRAPAGTTFASAALPASANGTIWYYTGAASPTPPAFLSGSAPSADWTMTRPGSVTWVAYWIPRLRSTYFPEQPDPASVIADFVVTVDASGDVCATGFVDNVGHLHVSRYTPLGAATPQPVPGGAITSQDTERVDVRPILPNLATSVINGPASLEPGTSGTWTIQVTNHDRDNNPVDTALLARAVINIPQVTANGLPAHLSVLTVGSGGGTVAYNLPGQITVSWPSILPNQSKTITLSLGSPLGVRNNSTVTVGAALEANDDFSCAPIRANPSRQTVITSTPALFVPKEVDLSVVAPGSSYNYTLRPTNVGTAPSSKTWVVDRIPNGAVILSAGGPAYGQVWFSNHVPPFDPANPTSGGLPATLIPGFPFSDAVIRAHFTPATTSLGGGRYAAPAGAKWVAFLIDDPAFSPPILGVGATVTLDVEVMVAASAQVGTTLHNDALIVSDELPQAIGNQVVTVVSPRPGLEVDKTCLEVISAGEELLYRIAWRNDTTNEDDVVTIIDTLPLGFVADLGDEATSTPPLSVTQTVTEDGRLRVTWIFPLQSSLEDDYIELTGHFEAGTPSGTFAVNEVVGVAENPAGVFSVSTTCTTVVQNADLNVQKLVDVSDPRSGEEVTFTLAISNENLRAASNVVLTDTLPAGMTYVGGSLQVTTGGWTLTSAPPANGATTLALTLTRAPLAPGVIPGGSGPIYVNLRALVGGVAPGTTLTNVAVATTTTGEDGVFPNEAQVSVTTPLPDPYLTLTGPPLVKPGDPVNWEILFGNEDREDANGTVIVMSLPEGAVADDQSDFTWVSHLLPPSVTAVYFSSAPLSTPPAVASAGAPGAGWASAPGATVNHILYVIGELDALEGPFAIYVSGEAREQDGDLPGAGGTFEACATISMIGAPFADADPSNNTGCAITRTPGVDVAVTVACTPSGGDPGLPPGEVTEFEITFENTGTVDAYGITLSAALDAILTLESHSASAVTVTTVDGVEANPVDTTGARVDYAVTWQVVGSTFVLGQSVDAQAPGYFRALGLKPGDRASVTVRARVADAVADSTAFSSAATISVAGRPGGIDLAEEILGNNQAACGATVYRADPFVLKSVANLSSEATAAENGDTLLYTVQFGNAGNFPASDVAITDNLPAGVSYVPGSLTGLPQGAIVEYGDGATWSPTGETTDTTGVRVRWPDGVALPAPANSTFNATTQADFDLGTFAGTGSTADGAVVLEPAPPEPLVFARGVAPNSTHSNLFLQADWVSQTVLNPAFLTDDAATLTALVYDRAPDGSTNVSTERFTLTVGYLNAALAPAPGAAYTLGSDLDANFEPGTATVVYDGPLSSGTGVGFTVRIPFLRPFEYDPSRGALVFMFKAAPFNGAVAVPTYNGIPTNGGITRWGQGTQTSPIGIIPHVQFETTTGSGPAVGTYTSPAFPGEDQGNVIRWGRAVVSSTLGDPERESVEIDVVTPDGEVVAANIAPDGTGTYDLSGISPVEHPTLSLRATLAGSSGQCTMDVAPEDDAFIGFPTGLNEQGVLTGWSSWRADYVKNPAAWAWTEPTGLVDLHEPLYDLLEDDLDGGTDGGANIYVYSNATGVDAQSRIVGHVDTNAMHPDVAHCLTLGGADDATVYVPPQAEAAPGGSTRGLPGSLDGTHAGAVIRHEQFIYDAPLVGDAPVRIESLTFRGVGGFPPGTGEAMNAFYSDIDVRMGHGKTAGTSTSQFMSNFVGEPVTVFDGSWQFSSSGTREWDVTLVLDVPFDYDPAQGSLIIDWRHFGDTTLADTWSGVDAANTSGATLWVATDPASATSVGQSSNVPWVQLNGGAARWVNRAIVLWTPDDAQAPTAWTAQCLPLSSDLASARPFMQPSSLIASTNPIHISDSGVIAGVQDTEFGFGTPVAWCPDGDGWRAESLFVAPEDEVHDDNTTVVTVVSPTGAIGGANLNAMWGGEVTFIEPAVWTPNGGDGCANGWTLQGLREALFGYFWGDSGDEGYVVDINAAGRLAVYISSSSFDGVLLLDPSPTGGYTVLGSFESYVTGQMSGYPGQWASSSLTADGEVLLYIQGGDEGGGFGFYFGDDDNSTRLIASGHVGITTSPGAVVGSVGFQESGGGFPTFGAEMWTAARGFVPIDALDLDDETSQGLVSLPVLSTDTHLVAGTNVDSIRPTGGRVWLWRECASDTPRLDAWSVTYETDRPPQLSFEVTVDDFCQTQIVNRVDVASSTPEIRESNNQGQASVAVNTANLAVMVTSDRDVVSPSGLTPEDDNVTFTATVTNLGPGSSSDVVVALQTPPELVATGGAELISDDLPVNSFSHDPTTGITTVGVDVLLPGQAVVIAFTGANTISVENALLTASASADARTIDCDPSDDVGSASVVVGAYPNLVVSIDGPDFATAGDTLVYTIDYTNSGNSGSTGVELDLVFPPGTVFVEGTVTPTSTDDTTATFDIGDVAPGEGGTIVVTLGAPSCGAVLEDAFYEVIAEIAGAENESSVVDNAAAAATYLVAGSGDVTLTAVSSHTSAQAGEAVRVTLYFHNAGANPVGGATLAAVIPGGASAYVAGSASAGGTHVDGVLTFAVGTLLAGELGSVTFEYLASAGASAGAVAFDAIGGCGAELAIAPATVAPAGLQVFISGTAGSVCAAEGADVDWSVLVTNSGAAALTGVVVTAPVPAGATYRAGTIRGVGADDSDATEMTWTIPTLPSGAALTLTFGTRVTSPVTGVVASSVSATSGQAQKSAAGAVPLDCGAHVVLTKAWSGACMANGAPVAIELTLTNTGSSAVRLGEVSDHLPAGMTAAPSEDYTWDAQSGRVVFAVPSLLPGERATFTVGVTPGAGAPGRAAVNRAAFQASGFVAQTSNQVAGAFLTCDDGDVCTVESCDPFVGCVSTLTQLQGVADVCDGVDNDCDAATDEDFASEETSCGVGACAATGETVCDGLEGVSDTCVEGEAGDEVCDTDDNDCDGLVDAADPDLVLELCAQQLGVCEGSTKAPEMCVQGVWMECTGAQYAGRAFPRAYTPGADVSCDGEDNSCSGTADDDYTATPTFCGVGACAESMGSLVCVDGEEQDTCDPLAGASDELCNGVDDDCDGLTDDDGGEGSVCGPLDTGVVCPAPAVSEASVTLTYENTADAGNVAFDCRIDGGAWFDCSGGSYTTDSLGEGQHVFQVAARDEAGHVDPTPAVCVWVVDDSPPDTFIPGHPEDPTASTTATFTFDSDESPVTYRCVLDPTEDPPGAEEYVACDVTEVFEGLTDGEHTLWVFATDTAGNEDPTPATYTWTVDTSVPDTVITSGPADPSPVGGASSFVYAEPTDPEHTVFECRLDGGEWVPCDGGETAYDDLEEGLHIFEVRACNPETGACDESPARWTWEIVDFICEDALALECTETVTVDAPADACEYTGPITATAIADCRQQLTVEAEEDTYPVGTATADFTASDDLGNEETCQTQVIVRDVTAPAVACGTWDVERGRARVSAEDACGLALIITDVACFRLTAEGRETSPVDDCPTVVDEDVLTLEGGVGAPLAVTWTVEATDPSGNVGTLDCEAEVDPDSDDDGVADSEDNCSLEGNADQSDLDEDDVGDVCDPTPVTGLIAQGGGGCLAGGATPTLWLVLWALVGLAFWRRRRQVLAR